MASALNFKFATNVFMCVDA